MPCHICLNGIPAGYDLCPSCGSGEDAEMRACAEDVIGVVEPEDFAAFEEKAWHRYDLETQPDGSIRGWSETNDDNDDGYPDGHVERWPVRYRNREEALKHCGKCRVGISGIDVTVTLDGEGIV